MTAPTKSSRQVGAGDRKRRTAEDFRALYHQILQYASLSVPQVDFLREVLKMLIDFSGCDAAELWLKQDDQYYRCEGTKSPKSSFSFQTLPHLHTEPAETISMPEGLSELERISRLIVHGRSDHSSSLFTKRGSFWTGDTGTPLASGRKKAKGTSTRSLSMGGDCKSLALIPLVVGPESIGLLQLKCRRPAYFTKFEIESYEEVAQNLGVAIVYQRARSALHERLKELTCLYGVAQASADPGMQLESVLARIAQILPSAWQYPEVASANIVLDGRSYKTDGFEDGPQKQNAEITVRGARRGVVEVVYSQIKPDAYEGPFLKEERALIDAVARQIALIIERRQVEEDRLRLQDQLRHADRLATIGQLAAGVAHELNEPLGAVLGFAQLAKKSQGLPEQARQDIGKIVDASLHAREVIKKLMTFARQVPPKKTSVNLNELVTDGLYFLESRCSKEGIELVRSVDPNLPEITADQAQLHQVLVNLAVNAIQAMPKGGRLTITTVAAEDHVSLIVEDTGIGMSEETKKKIFIPFFTTKDVGQGTGLGLAVVHGIVSGHRGSMDVKSKLGEGSRFEVQLPLTEPEDIQENDEDANPK